MGASSSSCQKLETILLQAKMFNQSLYHDQYTPFSVKLPNLKSIITTHVAPKLSFPILFSIFPERKILPVVRVIGYWAQELSTSNRDPMRSDSLMVLMLKSMTWISVKHDRAATWKTGVRGGHGILHMDQALSVIHVDPACINGLWAHLLDIHVTSNLKSMVLQTGDSNADQLSGFTIELCHNLEHMTLIISNYEALSNFAQGLQPQPYGKTNSWPGPRLKTLTSKGLTELLPVWRIIVSCYGAWPNPAIESGQLAPLEKLEVHYVDGRYTVFDPLEKENMESFLRERNVVFEWLPYR
ncbi:hypothetical protein FRC02_004745 [Tulasnella sp. 418]|nr:hypothetical protein FRC02_004745 [Tulasnella sp. 418]